MRLIGKIKSFATLFLVFQFILIQVQGQAFKSKHDTLKIQAALLLDLSSSMDELLNQTRSQIWNIANFLSRGKKDGSKPIVELALISYGSDSYNYKNYMSLHCNFTSDFDSIANQLFKIRTGGSLEFCWHAINFALDTLKWSNKKNDLKLIIIAGNESFDQGVFDSKTILKRAGKNGIVVNTIFCGSDLSNEATGWKDAALKSNGKFTSIQMNDSLQFKESSLDLKIIEYNEKLNSTYIPFGNEGEEKFKRLITQDENAQRLGIPFLRERISFKVSPHFNNATWDLLDAWKNDSTIIARLTLEEMPTRFSGLSKEIIEKELESLKYRRETFCQFISMRLEKIDKYMGSDQKKNIENSIRAILEDAGKKKGYVFE